MNEVWSHVFAEIRKQSCEKCKKAFFFLHSFRIQPTTLQTSPSPHPLASFILPAQPPAGRPPAGPVPCCPSGGGFSSGCLDLPVGGLFLCPEFTRGHSWSHWHTRFADISFSPHSCREAATISNLDPILSEIQLRFAFKSNATKSRDGGRNSLVAQQLHVGPTAWVLSVS